MSNTIIDKPVPKTLILYHADCIDGFTAAWACRKGLMEVIGLDESTIDAISAEYHRLKDIVSICKPYDTVYVVDFSLKYEVLEQIAENSDVFVLDHHKGAMEMYDPNWVDTSGVTLLEDVRFRCVITVDLKECGASLVWRWFFGRDSKLPELIKFVKDYDLWTHELYETKFINKYLTTRLKSFNVWQAVANLLESPTECVGIVDEGDAMHIYHMMLVNQAVNSAIPIELAGQEGLACNCPGILSSDVGHLLAERSGTFGACWQQTGNDIKWSLRSSRDHGNFDVQSLAKEFGGNGHHNAAGFVLSAPVADEIFPDGDSQVGISVWRI